MSEGRAAPSPPVIQHVAGQGWGEQTGKKTLTLGPSSQHVESLKWCSSRGGLTKEVSNELFRASTVCEKGCLHW